MPFIPVFAIFEHIKKHPIQMDRVFYISYFAALVSLIASIIIGTTLNRSPAMP